MTGRKALITGGDSGIGRAAAIAFVREGADVAINYLPAEESDAREVIEIIQRAGRKGIALPGDIRGEAFCQKWGLPLLAGLFLEINAGVIALMIGAFFAHEATALWDVSYAVTGRRVTPIEQHVHSFLEMLPLLAVVCVICVHWEAFLSLIGVGSEAAQFSLQWKSPPLPGGYVAALLTGIVLFEVLPYLEESWRALKIRGRATVPVSASSSEGASR